jgi:3-dehydroquinate dehydratase / shikimate dehydrogenase
VKFPLVCLTLSGKTIAEDVKLADVYRNYVDMLELRADYLEEDELLEIRKFPKLVQLPTILTIRRRIDGGLYNGGEAARTMLFARALAFADQNPRNNFAYVDFEEDFHIPSLQDAAFAFGTHIIRSFHDMNNPVTDLAGRFSAMCKTGYEIPKIACRPHNLSDVTRMFRECKAMKKYDHILCGMGNFGLPTRILADKLRSYLTFVSPADAGKEMKSIGHIDPVTLKDIYHFHEIGDDTRIFGITGYPLERTSSPELHNAGYHTHDLNAVYIPVCSPDIVQALEFAEEVGLSGYSVTIPFKETVLPELAVSSSGVMEIGACNTIVKEKDGWHGYNTDVTGIREALKHFLGVKNLKHFRTAIIGAGGAAKAVADAVYELGGKACIFNRTVLRAKSLAEEFNFKYAALESDSAGMLAKYSDLIIQTTSKGMGSDSSADESNDPLWFYTFNGSEKLFDIIYFPEMTPVMKRALSAGCKVSNGLPMLKYQGYEQFKIFTGVDYAGTVSE